MNSQLPFGICMATDGVKTVSIEIIDQHISRMINSENFWSDVLQKQWMRKCIKDHVRAIDIDSKVTTIVDRMDLESKFRRWLHNYLNDNLRGMVAQQLDQYLRSDHRMESLFEKYISDLEVRMSVHSREILDRIVSEDQYHEVNSAFFTECRNRSDRAIADFNVNSQNSLHASKKMIDDYLKTYQGKIDKLTSEIGHMKWVNRILIGIISGVGFAYLIHNIS